MSTKPMVCWSCGKEILPKEKWVIDDGQPIHVSCRFIRRRRMGLQEEWPEGEYEEYQPEEYQALNEEPSE